jgi:predicted O-methyltransferase YrrM
MSFIRFFPKYMYGLGCTVYTFTFGIASPRCRRLIWQICLEFGYPDGRTPAELPTAKVATLFPNDLPIILLEPEAANGNVTTLELSCLALLVKQRQPMTIFEIGTFDGRSSLNLIANAPIGARLFTLDLPEDASDSTRFELERADLTFVKKPLPGQRFLNTKYAGCIEQLLGDSGSFDFQPWHGKIDLIFVDGSHAYDYVLNDAKVALSLLKPQGGTILFHDYASCWDGVTRALNSLRIENQNFRNLIHIEETSLAIVHIQR